MPFFLLFKIDAGFSAISLQKRRAQSSRSYIAVRSLHCTFKTTVLQPADLDCNSTCVQRHRQHSAVVTTLSYHSNPQTESYRLSRGECGVDWSRYQSSRNPRNTVLPASSTFSPKIAGLKAPCSNQSAFPFLNPFLLATLKPDQLRLFKRNTSLTLFSLSFNDHGESLHTVTLTFRPRPHLLRQPRSRRRYPTQQSRLVIQA